MRQGGYEKVVRDTHPFQQALLSGAQSLLCDPVPENGAARSRSSIHGIPIELLLSAHTHAHTHTGTVEEKPQACIVKALHGSTTASIFPAFLLQFSREEAKHQRPEANANTHSRCDICSLHEHLLSSASVPLHHQAPLRSLLICSSDGRMEGCEDRPSPLRILLVYVQFSFIQLLIRLQTLRLLLHFAAIW